MTGQPLAFPQLMASGDSLQCQHILKVARHAVHSVWQEPTSAVSGRNTSTYTLSSLCRSLVNLGAVAGALDAGACCLTAAARCCPAAAGSLSPAAYRPRQPTSHAHRVLGSDPWSPAGGDVPIQQPPPPAAAACDAHGPPVAGQVPWAQAARPATSSKRQQCLGQWRVYLCT